MVLASHVIFTTYGFWLPNDPRGSWSTFVGAWELFHFGPATKVDHTRSVAHVSHDRNLRLAAKQKLKYPPVRFTGLQAQAIGFAISRAIAEAAYSILALSILPTHVHAVLKTHRRNAEDIVAHLKFRATRELLARNLHPHSDDRASDDRLPSMWTKRSWKVFLDSEASVRRAIEYVHRNPSKEGKPVQRWSFVLSHS